MTDFVEMADDIVDSWEDTTEFDDIELLMVPDGVMEAGNDAVDDFIHQEFVKKMSGNRYNRG